MVDWQDVEGKGGLRVVRGYFGRGYGAVGTTGMELGWWDGDLGKITRWEFRR